MKLHILNNQEIYLNDRQEKQYNLYMEAKGKVGLVKHSDGWRVYDPDMVTVVRQKENFIGMDYAKSSCIHSWFVIYEDDLSTLWQCQHCDVRKLKENE